MQSLRKIVTDAAFAPRAMLAYAVLLFMTSSIFCLFVQIMFGRLGHLSGQRPMQIDRPCGSPQCDFSIFWPAGGLARTHDYLHIYQPMLFWAVRQKILFPATGRLDWLYPPPTLLPSMLISHLPFQFAFVVWTTVQTLLAILLLRWSRLPWSVIIVSMLSPAALWNLELGQIDISASALLVAGLLTMSRAPWRAGGLAGLLTFKPQAGLLIPFVFAAARNIKAFIAAVFVGAAVLALTTAILGWTVWHPFLNFGRQAARNVLEAPFSLGDQQFGVSVFWMMRSFGLTLASCYLAQAASSALAIILTVIIWRRPGALMCKAALTVFLSLLTTPYGFTTDMVGYSIMLAALAHQRQWRIDLWDALFWLWPWLCPIVVMNTNLLLTPIIVAAAIFRTWRRAGLAIPLLPRQTPVLPGAGS